MLLVIFGAGASYDSVPHLPPYQSPVITNQNNWSPAPAIPLPALHEEERPPLADHLFDGRPIFVKAMLQFRECMEIVPLLRKPGISVEKELAVFQSQTETFPRVHQELAAIRYYLREALWNCQAAWRERHVGITNYATLLREIERWRYGSSGSVCFVTFNYDTMLEEAMSQVLGFNPNNLDSYIRHRYYTLIKLHGSINWGREVDGLSAPYSYGPPRLIAEAASLSISDRYRLMLIRPVIQEPWVLFPALSIPVERKDEFNCPSDHVERLKALMPEVTKVITIGWRATELDFLQLLGERVPSAIPLMVVSGHIEGARQTSSNLVPVGLAKARLYDGGFSGLILQHLERLEHFLRDSQR